MGETMTKKLFKTNGKRWCEVEVELNDGRLSICGSEGRIISHTAAKKEAREYWEGFFEESRQELGRMAIEHGTRTPKSAAAVVLRVDGEFHGLDIHRDNGGKVYITESCGQIDLSKWFPELAPFLPYHLNDLHAECEHQEVRGEKYTTHPGAICPDCGYKLGSAWLKRELPPQVLAWFGNLQAAA